MATNGDTMTTDTTVEDPRSLVRMLMRGDRQTGRRGDKGPLAALAAARQHGLPDDAALELVPYAYGFAVALNNEDADPGSLCNSHASVFLEGWQDGCRENPDLTLPAAVNA